MDKKRALETTDELLAKYRALHALHSRTWRSDEARNAVLALSLIVRQYAFGYCDAAVNAALLLEQSEPLENLTADDLAVKKMRALALVVRRNYDEALCILDPLMLECGDDLFVGRLHRACMEQRQPTRKQR